MYICILFIFFAIYYIINVFARRNDNSPNGRKYATNEKRRWIFPKKAVHKGEASKPQDKALQKSVCKGNSPKPQDKTLQKNLHRWIYSKS